MVNYKSLYKLPRKEVTAYRLINSKFPQINLFEDLAAEEEYDLIYRCQSLTNSRLLNELGILQLLDLDKMPEKIRGFNYAIGPFVHINKNTRFGVDKGVLYLADTKETAIREVKYHQEKYYSRVPKMKFERLVMRMLKFKFKFNQKGISNGARAFKGTAILDKDSYAYSQAFAQDAQKYGAVGLKYPSVRNSGAVCWALFTPQPVTDVVQSNHYEMTLTNGHIECYEIMAL